MGPRWWVLPLALTTLVVGACGAAPTAGGAPSSADNADPTTSTSETPSPSTAPSSAPPFGQCPPGGTGRGWAISLPSTGVLGADSPEAAANSTRYGLPPEYTFDSTTWTTVSSLPPMILLAQEQGTLEVSRMPDGSWYVTAGSRCD